MRFPHDTALAPESWEERAREARSRAFHDLVRRLFSAPGRDGRETAAGRGQLKY